MDKVTPKEAPTPEPRDALATAYEDAARVHAATLKAGSALEILTAFRAVLVAEIALLRASGGVMDRSSADLLEWDLQGVDRDLADLRARAAPTCPSET